MKAPRTLLVCATLIALTVLLLLSAMPATAYYDPQMAFATEVVLNKEGVDYDLDILEANAEEYGVVVITIEEEEYEDDSGDTVAVAYSDTDGSSSGEEEPQEGEKAKDVEPGEEEEEEEPPEDFTPMWMPGTYYVFKSHYDDELAVVLRELDTTYYTEDYQELQVKGLSILVAIQTEWAQIERGYEDKTLSLGTEVNITEDLYDFMLEMGWEDSGGGWTWDEETDQEKMVSISFSKGSMNLYVSSGEGGKSTDGPMVDGTSEIWLEGNAGSIDAHADNDVKVLMDELGLNGSDWDDAVYYTYTYDDWGLVPKGDIEPADLEWGEAILEEIEWLEEIGVLTGLTNTDKTQIGDSVGAGTMGYNDRIMYYNCSYRQNGFVGIFAGGYEELDWKSDASSEDISGGTIFSIDLDNLPGSPTGIEGGNGDSTFGSVKLIIAIIAIITVFIVLVFLIVFGFTRLRRKNLLANLNRKNIYEGIKKDEGVHFNGLVESLSLKPGVLSHHLNILEREEYIKSRQDGKYRRFFLYETKSELKIYLTTIQQKILEAVNESPGISQTKISKKVGSSRMMVNYHLKILKDAGIVSIEKEGRETACFTTELAAGYLSTPLAATSG